MNKCTGCGSLLQNIEPLKEGYTTDLNNKLCNRCFKIRHYNTYEKIEKNGIDYIKKINSNDLVLLITDLFNLNLNEINIKNPIILVLTKRDLLPRNTDENKLLAKITSKLNIKEKIIICSNNNYNLDKLYNLIIKYKTSNKVYVIGPVSTGKSTLINKMSKNYGNNDYEITTSILPSTTLDLINIKINDSLTLIDTPGMLDDGSALNLCDKNLFKKIIPKKEIKPVVIQVKINQTIVTDVFKISVKQGGTLVFYMSNNLKLERIYKETNSNLNKTHFENLDNKDIIIKGIGFIKCVNIKSIDIYISNKIKIDVRNSII